MIDLYKALLKAQAEMPPVKETSTNPHFKSRYADLETVIDTVRPVLNKHGLLFVQGGAYQHGGPWLITQLIHADSGQEINFGFPIVSKDADNPQAMGAAITYAKRYGLLAILGIATEDDDGNIASAPPQRQQRDWRDEADEYNHYAPPEPSYPQQQRNDNRHAASLNQPVTPRQLKFIQMIAREKGMSDDELNAEIERAYGKATVAELDRRDASAFIDRLQSRRPATELAS
jgi:hypothetical protein